MEIAPADVAFGTVCSYVSIGIVGAREVEAWELASSHRHRHVGRGLTTIAMGTQTKLIDPHVAAHMNVDCMAIHI